MLEELHSEPESEIGFDAEIEPELDVVTEIEPEPEPEPRVRRRSATRPLPHPRPRPRPRSRPRSRSRPKAPKIEIVAEPEPEPELFILEPEREPEPEPEPEAPVYDDGGLLLGTLEEVAGLDARTRTVFVFEVAFVISSGSGDRARADGEVIPFEEVEAATLTKIRLDLYREFSLKLKDGTTKTMNWLPDYNDDMSAVPLLRAALGDLLKSFRPERGIPPL